MDRSLSRRQFLFISLGLVGLWMKSGAWGSPGNRSCPLTPRQTEGPYYPPQTQIEALPDKDNDLTSVAGQSGHATGQMIYIHGQVRDAQCRPIEGALVEIWQASANGRYHHPRERGNSAPLDADFQYWGKTLTDADGRYRFKTIKPGEYEAGRGWIRPSHIHFKVRTPDRRELTTQLYFAGDPHQENDYILNDVPAGDRSRVIVPLGEAGKEFQAGSKVCRFDLTL